MAVQPAAELESAVPVHLAVGHIEHQGGHLDVLIEHCQQLTWRGRDLVGADDGEPVLGSQSEPLGQVD
ncbi:hypothetical protein [Ornithinimicrobium kibberense]|uniref:hypothetical protein n=1 Tax=Ornithinimicrobium kibberense TaxID=282060 RepID=UPI0036188743